MTIYKENIVRNNINIALIHDFRKEVKEILSNIGTYEFSIYKLKVLNKCFRERIYNQKVDFKNDNYEQQDVIMKVLLKNIDIAESISFLNNIRLFEKDIDALK